MSDLSSKPDGYGKLGAAILASFAASYIMTQCSLHGVNFELLGFPSELVKSSIVGMLVGWFTWITPRNFVCCVTNAIWFFRDAIKEWHDALTQPTTKE